MGAQTKDMIWLPLSIQPALCAVLLMFAGQKAREVGVLDKGALPPALWICAFMTWLYCNAFYGQLYMMSNTYQHGAIDVIGGDMRSRGFDQAGRARFRAAAHRHTLPRLDRAEHASAILHALRRAQRCTVERSFCLVRRTFYCGLVHHAGGSYRVLGRVDRGVVCAAWTLGAVVLSRDGEQEGADDVCLM